VLSYRLIEQPIRHRTMSRPRSLAVTAFLSGTAVAAVVTVAVIAGSTVSPVSGLERAAARAPASAPVTGPNQVVVPRVLIAGDSVALTLGYWLDRRQDTRGGKCAPKQPWGAG
jgi:hypothetical protein